MLDEGSKDLSMPLCVDVDGTLIKTDLLVESLCRYIVCNPWCLIVCLVWLLQGRAVLKRKLAERVSIDAALLPYEPAVIELVRREKNRGRRVVLATACDSLYAQKIADYLGLFDEIAASDGKRNLKGPHKAEVLCGRYGEGGFEYVGDSPGDIPVWRRARKAIIVNPGRDYLGRNAGIGEFEVMQVERKNRLIHLVKAVRVHQWVKNVLVFLPIVMAHRWLEMDLLWSAIGAFWAFSFCASAVYLINDICDIEADRKHPLKKKRPIASGELPMGWGVGAIPLLLACALGLALRLPAAFQFTLGLYFCVTLLYSLWVKKVMVIDILVLASLYAMRILGGGYATEVSVSEWLVAFSIFFFLSLASLKRFSELRQIKVDGVSPNERRGYQIEDLEQVSQLGTAAGYISVLVLALYVSGREVATLYSHPRVIWLICPLLLYWLSRAWLCANRGQMNDEPILFALRDRVSYLVMALVAMILLAAL